MKLLPSATSNLTNVNNIFTALKYFLGTPFTFIDNETFVSIYENNIYAVLLEDPLNIFDINLIYYNKYESLYESLQDAITASNPLSIGENTTDNVTMRFPFKTYTPYPAICSNNQDQIFIAPEKIDYEIEYCNTCTVILGDYTLVFKLQTHPYYDLESQYGPFYDLDYRLVSTTQPTSNGMNQIDSLNVEYSDNNIIFTFTSFDWNGTVTIDLDDFNLSGTMTGTGSFNYDQDLTNVTTAAFTFSNPIKPPEEVRVYLPDAFFSGNGNIQLGTIDEILTLDEELQCYISDELNIYNIPARIILPLSANTIVSNRPLIISNTTLTLDNHGQNTHYCNIDYNNYNGSFTVPYSNVDDVRIYSIYKAKEIDGYIAQRNIFLIDTHAHLIDTTEAQKINVFYAYFKNPAKEYFTLSSGSETYPNYVINPETGLYKPWHPNINTFKHANFIIQADGAFISSVRIGAAPDAPTITFNDDAIEQDEETLIIAGTDFNLNYEDNLVTFNLGAVGIVTAATTTQLTVTFTTQPTSLGNLEVTLLMPLSSGAAVQVATVVAGIVVTPNSDSRAINAPTLVIAGTGFSATANQNTVTFNLGAAGTVTSATTTELTITFSTQPTSTGSLTAVIGVSTSNGDSGTAVEVATIVAAPTVSLNAAYFPIDDSELIISGTGFDAGTPANNLVTFNHGAVGTVTAATSTQLTVSMDTQPNQTGNFTAFVNSFGGDSNTETVGNAIDYLISLGTVESNLTPYTIGWEVDSSGHGTQNNPFNVLASGENGDFSSEPADALYIHLVITYESGATLNWSGTWTDRGNAEMIWQGQDRMVNPLPPPAYVYFDDFVFVEYNHVGDDDSFTGSGSSAVTLPYSVGGGTYTAEFYLLIVRVNTAATTPSIDVNLWITY